MKTRMISVLMLSAILAQAIPAQAGLGIYIASRNENSPVGWILAAIGLGVGIDGLSSQATTQKCTNKNPCTNVDFGDNTNGYLDGPNDCGTITGAGAFGGASFEGYKTSGSYTYHSANVTQIIVGLVLLGTEKSTQINLLPVSSQEMADEMGMTSNEVTAFNHDLPKINLILNDFSSRLIQQEAISRMSPDQGKTTARNLWETEAQPVLSPDAFHAAEKAGAMYSGLMKSTD
jgi:hypothetical protein